MSANWGGGLARRMFYLYLYIILYLYFYMVKEKCEFSVLLL